MVTSRTEQLQDDLLKAAMTFLQHLDAKGHSLLVQLPGGTKLGIEVDLLAPESPPDPDPFRWTNRPLSTR